MSKKNTELINFYEMMPKNLKSEYHNPNYTKIRIKHPFRMLIIGSSGSGKSNCLLNLIYNMPDTFQDITIITKNADEPLYNLLCQKLGDAVSVYEGIENMPDLDTFDKTFQHLIVFDDLVCEKNQKKISEFYIRARKLNCSLCYLSQSFYAIPKIIRLNANYIILKKIGTLKDINMILRGYQLGVDAKQLKAIYEYATDKLVNFLLIDCESPEETRFRKGFTNYINI